MAEASGGENLYAIIGEGVDGIIRSEAPAPAVNPAEAEAVRAMPSIMHERPRHGATQISSGKVRSGVKVKEARKGGRRPFPLRSHTGAARARALALCPRLCLVCESVAVCDRLKRHVKAGQRSGQFSRTTTCPQRIAATCNSLGGRSSTTSRRTERQRITSLTLETTVHALRSVYMDRER